MSKYEPLTIESKWQQYWLENKTFAASGDSNKEKQYVLVEFPYPSGDGMHMGHVRPYTAADVVARYYRMKDLEVLFPMGWDAFGLPAENYAIKHGKRPAETTAQNISNIKKQFQSIGYSFDWDREINTTDPDYYKWTQWIFLQFYKAGLAFEDTGLINWCPKDKTGLANEEVVNGQCERCGATVEKKELTQWYLKITEYAEKLLQGLDDLPQWPEAVKLQQANWIGKSEGAEIEFPLVIPSGSERNEGSLKSSEASQDPSATPENDMSIKVFTTRPDTIFGATYVVLGPEHPLLRVILNGVERNEGAQDSSVAPQNDIQIENKSEVDGYIEKALKQEEQERLREDKEKTGVELKGVKAINPATGAEVPVWVADYVLGGYGTGAIMAVPAHDSRDFEFAQKFDLPVTQVVIPEVDMDIHGGGAILVDKSGKYLWQRRTKDAPVAAGKLSPFGGAAEGTETLLDCLSRELNEELELTVNPAGVRFLGLYGSDWDGKKEFALFYVDNIDKEKLVLHEGDAIEALSLEESLNHPDLTDFAKRVLEDLKSGAISAYTRPGVMVNSGEFSGQSSEAALPKMANQYGKQTVQYKLRDWVFSRQRYWGEPIPIVHCANCGVVPVPEDQLPVLLPEVENYEPTGTGQSPLAVIDEWVNTTCPQCDGPGKRETNTMPQWAGSSWYYLRYVDPNNSTAFADQEKLAQWLPVNIYFGGMEHTTLHLLYSRFWNLFLHDQGLLPVSEPYTKRVPHGIVLAEDGTKMSKSKGNVVNPDALVQQYGADATRMYELFLGPHGAMVAWNEKGITGVSKFLERIWRWLGALEFAEENSAKTDLEINKLIKQIGGDIETYSYNTAVAAFMKFYNEVKEEPITKQTATDFLAVLYPFVPHIAEELYQTLGGEESLQFMNWPAFDETKIVTDTIKIAVQVNGKLRDTIEVAADESEEEVKTQAQNSERVVVFLDGKPVKKIIYVPGKIVNLVV